MLVNVRLAAVQTIIFDYDDTLVRTREIRYGTLQRLAREAFAAEISAHEIDAAWGIPGDQFLLRLLGKFLGNDLSAMWRLYNQFCAEDPNALHSGVAEFLAEFSGRFSFGILTSSSGKRVHAELAELPIDVGHFTVIQTAEQTDVHKPNPEVFVPIAEKFIASGIGKQNILYVGDSLADYEAATGYGLAFIGMAHSERERQVFRRQAITHVQSFNTLAEVLQRSRF